MTFNTVVVIHAVCVIREGRKDSVASIGVAKFVIHVKDYRCGLAV